VPLITKTKLGLSNLLLLAHAVIYELNVTQESRQLSPGKIDLRRNLKVNILGLASLSKSMAR
jgi:hypothetical protein